jgi:hypothetical protein
MPRLRWWERVVRTAIFCPISAAAPRRASDSSLAAAALLFAAVVATHTPAALAGGGPLGIDYRVSYDNSGIWSILPHGIEIGFRKRF